MLWDTADGLWADERLACTALLVHISHEAPTEIRERTEALTHE